MPLNRVGERTEAQLLKMPETGMGFQVIRYRRDYLVVFNTILIIPLSELRERRFTQDDYMFLSGNPESSVILNLDVLDIQGDFSLAFSFFDREYRDTNTGLTFSEPIISPPDHVISPKRPYSYYRYSAFYKDKRVASDGSYLPGTYATTYNDSHFVPSGFAAVGRYALPNPASAQYVFPILTFTQPTFIGTAAPNFGQAGGGVEVLFEYGAQNRAGLSFMISAG